MTEHTPGPWRFKQQAWNHWTIHDSDVKTIASCISLTEPYMPSPNELIANVRLIAAAPNLLIALEKLVAADNCNYEAQTMRNSGYFDLARTAIAKARL